MGNVLYKHVQQISSVLDDNDIKIRSTELYV